jgi:hypothetical protein
VDGTPILDIKPYVPHYDCVGYTDNAIVTVNNEEREGINKTSCAAEVQKFYEKNTISGNITNNVRVPQWVDSGLKKRRSISFLPAAEQFLKDMATSSPSQPLESSSKKTLLTSSSSSLPLPLLSKMQFYGPNSPWQDSPSLAVQHIRNVIIEVLTADVRSVWQTAKARRGEFQAERSQRLATSSSSSSDEKKVEVEGRIKTVMEGKDHQEMIESCCTQQIDNLLVYYTIERPRTTTSTTTSDSSTTSASSTMTDERSIGSGAEDSVVVVSISLM